MIYVVFSAGIDISSHSGDCTATVTFLFIGTDAGEAMAAMALWAVGRKEDDLVCVVVSTTQNYQKQEHTAGAVLRATINGQNILEETHK